MREIEESVEDAAEDDVVVYVDEVGSRQATRLLVRNELARLHHYKSRNILPPRKSNERRWLIQRK